MRTFLILLILINSKAFSQTKLEIKNDLEWVAKTLQEHSKNTAFNNDGVKFNKVCKTDYDEERLTLTIHFYYEDMKKISSIFIDFAKLTATDALFFSDKNKIVIYFGQTSDTTKKSEIVVLDDSGKRTINMFMFDLSNDGEAFVWKKIKEKLEKIRLFASKKKKSK